MLRILNAPNTFLTINGAALTFKQTCQGCFLHPVSKAVGFLSGLDFRGPAEALTIEDGMSAPDCVLFDFPLLIPFPTWAKI